MPALVVPMATFTPSDVNVVGIAPILCVVSAALLCVLSEALAPRRLRHALGLGISAIGLVAALTFVVLRAAGMRGITLSGAVVVDGPTLVLQGLLLVVGGAGLVIMAERFGARVADAFTASGSSVPGSAHESQAEHRGTTTEIFPLTLLSIAGMLLFPAAGDLLTMFVALEILSLPLYVLVALARRRRLLSQEAALKYFLLGSFSSAFFLFGAALLYGFAGSLRLSEIASALGTVNGRDGLIAPGVLMVFVGLLFKVGAVPFHSWTPDVYQGAPTSVAGFMAACTKIAAFGAMLRFTYVGVAGARWDIEPVLWVVTGATMLVGAVLSVRQTDIKRLLAYSSIAHAGFILVGVLAFDRSGVAAVLFYLVAYSFSTTAAFGLVTLVRSRGSEATHISQWAGLGQRRPFVAGGMALVLMAFAGIPLTSGFAAKFAVFSAGLGHGGTAGAVLVVLGVVCSVITAFGYFRIIVLMFFSQSDDDSVEVLAPSLPTAMAITLGLVVTVVLGVFPAPALELVTSSGLFLR